MADENREIFHGMSRIFSETKCLPRGSPQLSTPSLPCPLTEEKKKVKRHEEVPKHLNDESVLRVSISIACVHLFSTEQNMLPNVVTLCNHTLHSRRRLSRRRCMNAPPRRLPTCLLATAPSGHHC